ncbi:MAG: ABC transporter ATP-binding protein/permease [Erysipelotrichaceae bacterium]|nr:ABC transporter ATP-binding protein/permease [Erysipelotrichaceae bacterium]
MLQIKNIKKTYVTGSLTQVALDDVSLNLRDNEFVAILGPSGSGKTTLLNIIGGLDRYDEGDLLINGISTKDYKDRDWDAYRNHTIGFVFQSYNLIPHQTVLSNVELALTIGGVGKKERRQRALKALEEVGLADQAHKKPNQMSGGQMQRVAIARALVNNPDILLADEPTGALDTKTSIQVMDLLKEVAKDRLVVMVTHNPDLANEYANRIINLKDGKITGDSNPYEISENLEIKNTKFKRSSMSIFTALSLSFNNLLTKKGRTILTAFAGSIGIIGIALILALSTGIQNYIDEIQEETLTSYPLTITSETADATSAILSMVSDYYENNAEGEQVIERQYLTTMFSSIGSNDLKTFKKYLEDNKEEIDKTVKQIQYTYSITPYIYTYDATDTLVRVNPTSILSSMYSSSSMSLLTTFSGGGGIFNEMYDDMDAVKEQYDVLKGRWPENFNEVIIVLSEPNSISDLLTYSIGLKDTSKLKTIITELMAGEEITEKDTPIDLTYDDLLNIEFKLINATDLYEYNNKYDLYEDMSEDKEYMEKLYKEAVDLDVVGIVCVKPGGSNILSPGVAYTRALTEYIIGEAEKTTIVQKQLANKEVDVISGKRFDEENEEEDNQQLDFQDMISVDEDIIKEAFKINIDEDTFNFDTISEKDMQNIIVNASASATSTIESIPLLFIGVNNTVLNQMIDQYEQLEEVHNEDRLIINEEIIKEIETATTKDKYKEMVNKTELSFLLSSVSDEDYEKLSEAVVDMFDGYYNSIKLIANENNEVLYDNENPENTKYICIDDEEITLSRSDLISISTVNIPAIIKIAEVTANNAEPILQTIIAGSASQAVGGILTPVMDSLSKLGDVFSEDLMTIDTDKFAEAFKFNMTQDELSRIMQSLMTSTTEKTYSSNLISLGYQDLDDPYSISFYFKDFASKEAFIDILTKYNEGKNDEDRLQYTDITGLLMTSVKKIIDSLSNALIAFVSISLVVSSIMIAVITLISVMERTKEIGILRAMGASKRNVSSIFNAETFIIGLLSGGLGVGISYLSMPLVNVFVHRNSENVTAVLPTEGAIVLVLVAVALTIFAGIIPSKKASKQDPVVALRSE